MMLEVLQYATSGFWTFIGCFLLLGLTVCGVVAIFSMDIGSKEPTT